jgi:hypothetical protein
MSKFHSIKELINTLAWSKELLSEMFEKRKSFVYKYDHALEIMEEERLETLKNKGVLRQNGPYLEMDDQFQLFFEQILEVNEDINTSFINENIQQVKQQINYYLQENNENRRYAYLKAVKSLLRKTGRITLRNIIDLNRNIENVFKSEPNYKIKISRLENFDQKQKDIQMLIDQTDRLVTQDEQIFFKTGLDEELKQIVTQLRLQLNEGRHNLIETQKQIIEYLNQVKYQSRTIEHIRQVKYLKDQFELRAKTNVLQVIAANNAVAFEQKATYPLKLSLEELQTDAAQDSLKKIVLKLTPGNKPKLPVAEEFSSDYLVTEEEREIFINLDELKNGFQASGNHLYQFIMQYGFPKEISFEEKVTVFCQMVSLYEKEFTIMEEYNKDNEVEYAMVYPK